MGLKSILFSEEYTLKETEPDFFRDVNLHYIIDMMRVYTPGYDAAKLFYTFPVSEETMKLRHVVFFDLDRNPGFREAAVYFGHFMRKAAGMMELAEKSEDEIKRAGFHMRAAGNYLTAVKLFSEALSDMKFTSPALLECREHIGCVCRELTGGGFEEAYRECVRMWDSVAYRMSVKNGEISLIRDKQSSFEPEKNYLKDIAALLKVPFDEETDILPSVFKNPLATTCLEETVAALIKRSEPGVYESAKSFMHSYPSFFDCDILRYEQELQFYIASLQFRDETERKGKVMCFPAERIDASFMGVGVYDVVMLWQAGSKFEVVANDFEFPDKPSFLIVTGPNGGGKTTFARSLGQAVYFAMMGMPVNAELFTLPNMVGIMTHFENEENLFDNAGKLKDEINRLIPMVKGSEGGRFVILNELFTTATTKDALVMGQKITEIFIKRGDFGVYVTHMSELAGKDDALKSMVAETVGTDNRRTYRIIPDKPKGLGFSDALVRQYELTYDDIMRVLP